MSVKIVGLDKYANQLRLLQESQLQELIEGLTKEIAARLLSKVIKRTPVGQHKHKTGGTLRRGWTNSQPARSFCQGLTIEKSGNTYHVEIINPVEYASYVEFGHRDRTHTKWIPGKFMLTISEQEVNDMMPTILERKIEKKLREVFNGQ